ncbi:hypothetical protein M4I33_16485 [Clostridium sp. LY3-2]|uniref:hypothetical protein n=1 Tax=Clostridium sp. LY3-2 TaxID=2942482 RepID=UPI00215397D3|nr:hypothetical protein [Clostridium sp. LY3-2]MCR6516454.1 hypothetical protein [Clostridium sp. LY3-2]
MNDSIIYYKNMINSLENDTTKKEHLLVKEAVSLGFTVENSIYYFKSFKNDIRLYVFSLKKLIEIKNIQSDNVEEIEVNFFDFKKITNVNYRKDRFYFRRLNFTIGDRVFQFVPLEDYEEFKETYSSMLKSFVNKII